jgi:hypothetical protein
MAANQRDEMLRKFNFPQHRNLCRVSLSTANFQSATRATPNNLLSGSVRNITRLNPRGTLWIENLRQPPHAFTSVSTDFLIIADNDFFSLIRTAHSAPISGCKLPLRSAKTAGDTPIAL